MPARVPLSSSGVRYSGDLARSTIARRSPANFLKARGLIPCAFAASAMSRSTRPESTEATNPALAFCDETGGRKDATDSTPIKVPRPTWRVADSPGSTARAKRT